MAGESGLVSFLGLAGFRSPFSKGTAMCGFGRDSRLISETDVCVQVIDSARRQYAEGVFRLTHPFRTTS